jgi:hypothetical protein
MIDTCKIKSDPVLHATAPHIEEDTEMVDHTYGHPIDDESITE